jgi:hypothetical protein
VGEGLTTSYDCVFIIFVAVLAAIMLILSASVVVVGWAGLG